MRLLLALTPLLLASATPPPIMLDGKGLTLRGGGKAPQRLVFGTPRAKAIAATTAVLGKPVKVGSVPDCGQGIAIAYARFKGAFELSFIAGKLSGFTAEGAGAVTERGIAVGSDRRALAAAYSGLSIDGDAADGFRWSDDREDGLSGFISSDRPGGKVTGIVGGETCVVT